MKEELGARNKHIGEKELRVLPVVQVYQAQQMKLAIVLFGKQYRLIICSYRYLKIMYLRLT